MLFILETVSRKDQKVIFLQNRTPVRHKDFAISHNHRHEKIPRKLKLCQRLAAPAAPFL